MDSFFYFKKYKNDWFLKLFITLQNDGIVKRDASTVSLSDDFITF